MTIELYEIALFCSVLGYYSFFLHNNASSESAGPKEEADQELHLAVHFLLSGISAHKDLLYFSGSVFFKFYTATVFAK